MKHILAIFLCLLFISCSDYDSQNDMIEKCKNLKGLNEFILNKTTIEDIYQNFNADNIISGSGKWTPNLPSGNENTYNNAEWKPITIKNYNSIFTNASIRLDFYKDTLTQISYRFENENTKNIKKFIKEYGQGILVDQSYLDSITHPSERNYGILGHYFGIERCRRYQNGNIHLFVDKNYWDIIVFHAPRLKKLFSAIDESKTNEKASTTPDTNPNTHKRTYREYTNPIDGSKSNKYKGSLEQLRDLQMIDEYMRNNPDF